MANAPAPVEDDTVRVVPLIDTTPAASAEAVIVVPPVTPVPETACPTPRIVLLVTAVMVSVEGQLDLRYVPFDELVDPVTIVTKVRMIPTGSDFHRLARALEYRVPPSERA